MKYLYILLLVFYYTSIMAQDVNRNDLISINVDPSLINIDTPENLEIHIHNNSNDTLLLINDFYFMGIKSKNIAYPMNKFYFPNLLIMRNCDSLILEGDNFIPIKYNSFPQLLVISPKVKSVLNLSLISYDSLIRGSNWKISSLFMFAKKADLDSIINVLNDEDMLLQYNNSLNYLYSDKVNVKLIEELYLLEPNYLFSKYMEIINNSFTISAY